MKSRILIVEDEENTREAVSELRLKRNELVEVLEL